MSTPRTSKWFVVGLMLLLGCGGSSETDVAGLLAEFEADEAAAMQKYKGKVVRMKLEKVDRTQELNDDVLIDGRIGKKIVIWAIVTDEPEGKTALALKPGDPVAVEGEIESFTSSGFQLKPARIVPK